jgi:hypothetical protein
MTEPYYADFDGLACRFTAAEGWVLHSDGWKELNAPSVNNAARIVTKELFDQFFPDAPPLPKRAFKAPA